MMRLATAASSGFLMARLFGDGALLANAAIAGRIYEDAAGALPALR